MALARCRGRAMRHARRLLDISTETPLHLATRHRCLRTQVPLSRSGDASTSRPHPAKRGSLMHRNLLLEAEIEATKHLLAECDAMSELTGDFSEGDAHMERLIDLAVQAGIPRPRQP